MLTKVNTFKLDGVKAVRINVECDVAASGIGIHLVGLADDTMKRNLLRTVTAMDACGYRVPWKKVIINLAPADLRREGNDHYDLPIAVAIIAASEQEPVPDLNKYVIAGELGLDGRLREIPGWMQIAELARDSGKTCILPEESAKLAARAMQGEVTIYGASCLQDVVEILNGDYPPKTALDDVMNDDDNYEEVYELVRNWWDTTLGHEGEKRALEIAAAGGHPILLMGAPGSGKSELAHALLDILPPMSHEESNEVQEVYSASGKRIVPFLRPFRAPHFAASMAAMLGGGFGGNVLPGEVSLAHNGVLYFDECVQAPKTIMEALRVPLEDGKVTISRLKSKVDYPTKFFPVFATNPCPCGYYGEGDRCTCTPAQRQNYLANLSGPVYDRLTMQIWCHPAAENAAKGEPVSEVAERVRKARERQLARQGKLNDALDSRELDNEYPRALKDFIETLMMRTDLSARSYTRMLKIARTIADLDGREQITTSDVAEAASYRFLDRRTL